MMRFLMLSVLILFASECQANDVVFRFNRDLTGHFYTTDCTEAEFAAGEYQMLFEGQAFMVKPTQTDDSVALYRFFYNNHHFYTTSADGEGHPEFVREGVLGYIYPSYREGTTALYRSFNPQSGDHFYTIDEDEYERIKDVYSGDRFIVGYVPLQGAVTCQPSQARFKVYPPTAPDNVFTRIGDGWKRELGNFFTPAIQKDSPRATSKTSPLDYTYSAVYRVRCRDVQTGVDRADTTRTYLSKVSVDDAQQAALNATDDICQSNGDTSRVTVAGSGHFL